MTSSGQTALRVLVAGAGSFGQEHLRRLFARQDVAVAGVADQNPAALDAVRQRHGPVACFETSQQMVEEVPADAIIVSTPAASHAEIALQAMSRRLGVLLEKPVTPAAAEAESLARTVAEHGAFVLPGHVLRFSRDHRKLAEIVESGAIGRVLHVNSRRYRDDPHAARYSDIDPVLMTMIHDIDLAMWIARSPFRTAWASRAGTGGRSLTAASIRTESGVVCDLRTAWTFKPGELPQDRLEVVGETGGIELDTSNGIVLHAEGRRTVIPLAEGDDPLANEQDHFFGCLRDRSLTPALDLNDAAAGLRLADAICVSQRLGSVVDLNS